MHRVQINPVLRASIIGHKQLENTLLITSPFAGCVDIPARRLLMYWRNEFLDRYLDEFKSTPQSNELLHLRQGAITRYRHA
jgi:hypothetical protein